MTRSRRAARVATDTALHSPRFVVLFDHELFCLDGMPAWCLRLFVQLVRLSNFTTGAGSVQLRELVQLMTPTQPRSGPKAYVPNARAVREAVLAFERAHILARDKRRSEEEGRVFFLLSPRNAKVRPTSKLGGGTRRGVDNSFSEGKTPPQ